MTNARSRILLSGAVLGAIAVLLGAFGAHGLRLLLTGTEMEWWQTAVQYQMWHALALVAMAALPVRRLGLPALFITVGVILFSGSLYAMALTEWRHFGLVTPVGGLSMISGWVLLAWRCRRTSTFEANEPGERQADPTRH